MTLYFQEEKLKRELWETMIATFMNNIQIQIERIHIRYEDSVSIPGFNISGGLCLQSLTAETTNSKWKETDINGKAATIFKLVKFDKFSLYCVCGDNVEIGKHNNNNWRLAMGISSKRSCKATTAKMVRGLNFHR